ncbi:MAG: hypothetical protein F6J90_20765 [Moorea sp. SIOASIH]|uniref:SdrD B-like domain-containing protein n=1 Tax=Moorena sp. SIOASIH TaxID=2607817 RepID=UPI0013BAF659|nr:SdrD B-like domain-containing protein [Moorena sp. SIOASIH]NEO38632.1 hypothetical protein [Moorena sp. SIOASIH]
MKFFRNRQQTSNNSRQSNWSKTSQDFNPNNCLPAGNDNCDPNQKCFPNRNGGFGKGQGGFDNDDKDFLSFGKGKGGFQGNYFKGNKGGLGKFKDLFDNDDKDLFGKGKGKGKGFGRGKGGFNCNPVDENTGEIGNKVWLDANRNGIFDEGEEGVKGVKVTLTGAGEDGIFGTGDDITKVRTTKSNGKFNFKNLAAGNYKLTFSDLPSDLEFTTANVGDQESKDSDVINISTGMTDVITLEAGEINNEVTAGLVEPILKDGTYQLSNHPDGTSFGNWNPHGLILTGLFEKGIYQTGDIAVFNFDHPDTNMQMSINGDEIRIFGTAFGHLDVDGNFNNYDDQPGLWQIDFTYNNADHVSDDDDLSVDAQFAGSNTGIIKQLYGDQREFELTDEAGSNSFSFQVGNKTDNQGHRGVDGISGWGWLNHSNADQYVYHSDWLFTVDPGKMITGDDGNNDLSGDDGNNGLSGGKGNDTLRGGEGDDILYGGEGNDTLRGGEGNDTLKGTDVISAGANTDDLLEGGAGADLFVLGDVHQAYYIEPGKNDCAIIEDFNPGEGDVIQLHGSIDDYETKQVNGGIELLYIKSDGSSDMVAFLKNTTSVDLSSKNFRFVHISGEGNDTLSGHDGNDSLYGANGDDLLDGGKGNDSLSGDDGNDSLYGANGNDSLRGDEGDDLMYGGKGNDSMRGDKGNDSLYGDEGDDLMYGSKGNDTLIGGEGNDTLNGTNPKSGGANTDDILSGGAGADRFILGDVNQAYYVAAGLDDYAVIEDFNAAEGDVIQLHGSIGDYQTQQGNGGTELFYQNDMVAFLENTTNVDLTSNNFEFV